MKITKIFLAVLLVSTFISCAKKEEKKVCADKVRAEYKDPELYATVEEGCVIKYQDPNSYKVSGSLNLTVTEGTEKTINLGKGELVTKGGEFIIKSETKMVKVRLIKGAGSVKVQDRSLPLETGKVLEMGS